MSIQRTDDVPVVIGAQPVPATVRHQAPITLSAAQRTLWSSQRSFPDAPLQNMALVSHLDGEIDAERLALAFARVVEATDVLRTRIVGRAGAEIVQLDTRPAESLIIDLARTDVSAWATERAATPSDLSDRAYDSVIIRHDDRTVSWYLMLHHVVTDATSSALVFEATAEAYHGRPGEFSSYYAWNDRLESFSDARRSRSQAFWSDRQPAPRTGRLYRPAHEAGRALDPRSGRTSIELDDKLLADLQDRLGDDYRMLSPDLGWTTLLMTTAAVLLHRVSGADRCALGLPVHNRTAETQSLLGPVMEVFPVDVDIRADDTYRTLHARVGRSILTTLRHARPGLAPAQPDVEAIVNVIPRAGLDRFGQMSATTEWVHSGAIDPNHLFRLQLTPYSARGLQLDLDISSGAADDQQIDRAAGHLRTILEDALAEPDRSIGATGLCGPDEQAMLDSWGTGEPIPDPPTDIVTQLRRRLAAHDGIALEDPDGTWTGPELLQLIEAVADDLRSRGIGPGARVAIDSVRCADAVIAIMATLFAGGSYVPLDPSQPPARLGRLVERAGCAVRLSDLPLAPTDHLKTGARSVGAAGETRPSLDHEAYLLFTSGSTGEPKGVPITHRGLADYLAFASDAYVGADGPVVPLFSALTFDLTVTSLFLPLLTGGRLVIIRPDGPAGLAQIAERTDLTWAKATPSHLDLLVRMLPPEHGLRTLVVGGEAFPGRLAAELQTRLPHARIFNEYGPTEAVVGCMIHEAATRADAGNGEPTDVPIGRPAPGVRLMVVDQHHWPTPIGAVGELLISHRGVTAGYLDGPDPTGAFVELDGERYYRSGDLVRLIDDETLLYLGRVDEQLKVGGIRLDPSEIEAALLDHPAITGATARVWAPTLTEPESHCVRCGLPSNVPGVGMDDHGVCDTCHDYARIRERAAVYFRTPADLVEQRDRARVKRTGDYDCIHLLSGGKDSTYALYQLVERGFDVYALTLDNGFISEGAKDNVRRSVAELGIDHEFATSESMDAIFRDSLQRHSNVCHGCYKTIYTLATARAVELGVPLIVTGLSRGQLFETRLVPAQFTAERFDPDAIDRAVLEARRMYHRIDDGPNRLLDTSVFADDSVFETVEYLDFYRYVDVELAEMYSYLDTQAPWVRPSDTGRSTNCLINAAGIHTHLQEQGFHNYAVPYAWDVRLGHKTRDEAIAELDDQLDLDEVDSMLRDVDYVPQRREILTAWIELDAGANEPDPVELRSFLAARLPAYAIPAAFVAVDAIPLSSNGKVDTLHLPAPERVHRAGPTLQIAAESELEVSIVAVWERMLGVEPIGVTDDFFALGGDSLAALGMITALSTELGVTIREELAFVHTTPRELATAIGVAPAAVEGGTPSPVGTPPPLSAGEQAILYEHLLAPEDPRYNVGHLYRVRTHGLDSDSESVDLDRLETAMRTVVSRHEPLHWTYAAERRQLGPDEAFAVEIIDEPTETAARLALAERHRAPFDLTNGPLGRACFAPLANGDVLVMLAFHHVSIDAGSFDRVWAQINDAYRGVPPVDLAFTYADHTAWQRERIVEEHRAHWSGPDRARVPDATMLGTGGGQSGYLTIASRCGPDDLRAGPGPTPFATALTALAATLRSRTDGDAVGLGITVSTRDHPEADPLIGFYLNTLPLVIDVPSTDTFAQLAKRCGGLLGEALAHRAVPFADIVADRRSLGLPAPETSVLLAFEELDPITLGSHRVDHEILASGSAVADATIFVQVYADHVDLAIEHDGETLTAREATMLLHELDQHLCLAIDAPNATIAEGPGPDPLALIDAEQQRRLATWGTNPRPTSSFGTLHEMVRAGGELRLDRPAVVGPAGSLTHGDLARRSDRVASALNRRGIGPGQFVGVMADRDPDTVVAILGVLQCGAAYVPIDPAYPADRLAMVIEDTGIQIVLAGHGSDRPPSIDAEIIDLASIESDDSPGTETVDGDGQADPADPAYIIHTSGSTGRPKGVVISHRNIVESTSARAHVYSQPVDTFLLLSSFAFDSSMVGLFWTLACGGTIVLPEDGRVHDPRHLSELIREHQVTHTLALPSLYQLVLDEADWNALRSLSTVIVAGEACPLGLVRDHHNRCPAAELVNEYGPTEGTVWSHAHHVGHDESASVSIGGPIPNATCLVLDPLGRLVPPGTPGELLIGGLGLAEGYLGRPDLTAERFVEVPPPLALANSTRFYRTGDRVAWRDDGTLDFLGRVDDQLKIRGHRIEPGEIEAALGSIGGIEDAVVVAKAFGSDHRLVAFARADVTGAADPARRPSIDRIRNTLQGRLPAFMIPSHVEFIDAYPLTPNGKADRSAIAELPLTAGVGTTIGDDSTGERDTGPVDPRLDKMASLWAGTMGLPTVGPDDDFFDLGGHSLLAVRLFIEINSEFGENLPLAALFEAPTPRTLLARMDHDDQPFRHLVPITTTRTDRPTLYCVHGFGGNVLNFRELAQAMADDWSFVGIQASGVDGVSPLPSSMDEMIESYLAELRAAQPVGPYLLAGYSNGGLVAYEMAQRLRAEGESILAVVLLDTLHPEQPSGRISRDTHMQQLRRDGVLYVADRLIDRRRRRARAEENAVFDAHVPVPGEPIPFEIRERQLYLHNRQLMATYPTEPYPDKVILVSATGNWKYGNLRTDRGWAELATDMKIVPTPGDHTSLLEGDNAKAMARTLSAALEKLL